MTLRPAAIAAALFALSACAGPCTVASSYRRAATDSELVYATANGPLLVQVKGNPFGGSSEEFAALVAREMSGQTPGRPFAMTADPALAPHFGRRVVVAFNAPPATTAEELCKGRPPDWAGPNDPHARIDVLAAFCDGGQELTDVMGWVADVDGPRDPRFRFLMGDIVRQLF